MKLMRQWIKEIIFYLSFLALVGLIVVFLSVSLYTQAECLRNGYPKYAVTIGLERYCITLDGAITAKVEQMSKPK